MAIDSKRIRRKKARQSMKCPSAGGKKKCPTGKVVKAVRGPSMKPKGLKSGKDVPAKKKTPKKRGYIGQPRY